MHMTVDPAGQGDEARRFDHLIGLAQIMAKRGDTTAANADIASDDPLHP